MCEKTIMLLTTLLPFTVCGLEGWSFGGELNWKKFDVRLASKLDYALLSVSLVAVRGTWPVSAAYMAMRRFLRLPVRLS